MRRLILCLIKGAVTFAASPTFTFAFINSTDEFINDFIYDHAFYFSEGFSRVYRNDGWNYIDKSGNLVIDFQYNIILLQYPFLLQNVKKS